MAQIPLPIISQLSSSGSPRTTDNQNYDISQVFAERLCPTDVSYEDFFRKYLLQNKPCIFSSELTQGWLSRQHWVDKETRKPNLAWLKQNFGDVVAPVANCGQEKFSSHCKEEMKLKEFLDYWENYISQGHPRSQKCLYLKDWHFTKVFPSYQAYSTPVYFLSDWMNEFWDCRADSDDDYRFVYMGPKGTWTPFHADVFRSYSWSANICGRKRWIFIAPGEEEKYRNKFGNLVYDINSDELHDPEKYPHFSQSTGRIEVIQEPGEVIFVPSGWHHQVHNLEDTISINHNWMNGCNIHRCWKFLKQELSDVQREISDCQDMEGWHEQCQLILKASTGINFSEFYQYLVVIATHRMDFLQLEQSHEDINKPKSSGLDEANKHLNTLVTDLSNVLELQSKGTDHSGVLSDDSQYKAGQVDSKLHSNVQYESEEGTKNAVCEIESGYLMDKNLILCSEKTKPCCLAPEEMSMAVKGEKVEVCHREVTTDLSLGCTGSKDLQSERHIDSHQSERHIDSHQSERHIDSHQSERHIDSHQSERHIDSHQSERHIDSHQSERHIDSHQSERHIDSHQSERHIDSHQSERHIDSHQSERHIDSHQSERHIDSHQSERHIDLCQHDGDNSMGQRSSNFKLCDQNKGEIESETGSVYHAVFDLIQVKQTLVDMIKTEEFKLIYTDPDASSMIGRINCYVR
ncbi:uncharacterized protein LOC117317769 isoform X2 [Pecten maximus]|uniref:uncharacterized protein LOC117317769 isoform X2 n=1 Tax=Pecten maximus TaxID=6579 RepID=UPI00145851C4|nr:uncharacterized protein LOC117317769 isoform X2 [Pecten maximus]